MMLRSGCVRRLEPHTHVTEPQIRSADALDGVGYYICVHRVQLGVSKGFFPPPHTLMASLARLFLWKPSCHGNTVCLVEFEMSSSFLRSSLSVGLSFTPVPLSSPYTLPPLWQTGRCQSESLPPLRMLLNSTGCPSKPPEQKTESGDGFFFLSFFLCAELKSWFWI